MDFNNHVKAIWTIGGVDIWITETIINTWIIMAALILLAVIVRIKLKKFTDVPTGFQNLIEMGVETMHNFVIENMGEKYAYFGNYFFGVIVFIACSNLSGLVYLRPPTADLATTFTLGMMTFFLIHFMGIRTRKSEYFKDYFRPYKVFFILNFVGELAPPISLSFRLFGNIFGGLVIMGLVYNFIPTLLSIGIPAVAHVYFDLFAGLLQSFIFVILSMTFIRQKLPD